jgi:AcrR family transcriptional regulator
MPPAENRAERAERILDAAAELLLRVGYRRTTIEDVAERADVGKGTLYLHWKTREALFLAVLLRESLAAMDDLLAGVAADPQLVRPSLLLEFQYRNVLARPLLRATRTGDAELLGKLLPKIGENLDPRHDGNFEKYLDLLRENGMLRPGRPSAEVAAALSAVLHGFLYASPSPAPGLLAETVAHAFEPVDPPSEDAVRAVAPRALALFTEAAEYDRARLRAAY